MAALAATEFSLRTFIRACIEEGGDNSPRAVADRVADTVPEEHLRDAVRTGIHDYVRAVVSLGGGASRVRHSDGSTKWTDNSAAYREVLRAQVCVGGEWKPLGDCNKEDLVTLAHTRERQAAEVLERAKEFRKLAAAVARAGVKTVGELPAEQVLKILDD